MFNFEIDFNSKDFDKCINELKNNTLEENIKILYETLKGAYTTFSFPENCCDFSTFFSGFIFSKLGYNTIFMRTYLTNTDHSFLKVNDEYIDFTIEQFHDAKAGIIKVDNFFDEYYEDFNATMWIRNTSFDMLKDDKFNFMSIVVYKAVYDLINKFNISDEEV